MDVRLVGAPVEWRGRLQAALLASGENAFVAARAAETWWGVAGAVTEVVEILTDIGTRIRLDGVVAHRTIDLPAADRSLHRGLQVTGIDRTLIDLGRHRSPKQVGASLDRAVRDGLTTYDRFEQRVQELGARGRNGIGTARLVLADRGHRDGWAFEKAMRALFRRADLPDPIREFRVVLPSCRSRVDWCFSDEMVGIECDSRQWHGLRFQQDYDAERQNKIQNAGLLLLRFTPQRLRLDPEGIVDEIVDALRRRRGLGAGPTPTFPDARPVSWSRTGL